MRCLILCLMLTLKLPLSAQDELLITDGENLPGDSELGSLDLNETDAQTLGNLTSLSDHKISNLLDYRKRYGPFISPLELQVVPGLSGADIRQVLTVFHVTEKSELKVSDQGFVLIRSRYRQKTISGNRSVEFPYLMARLKYEFSPSWRAGLVVETDYGEKITWDPKNKQYLMDHLAGYLEWQPSETLRIVAGNFRLHFGQGLLSGSGFNLGKNNSNISGIAGAPASIRGYYGLQESTGKAGIVASLLRPGWRSGIYFGSSTHDARVRTKEGNDYIFGFQSSGNHRTENELTARKGVRRNTAGFYLIKSLRPFLVGGIMEYNKLSVPLRPQNYVYDIFSAEGSRLLNLGFLAQYNRGNVHSWLELAMDQAGKKVRQAGILTSLGRRWTLLIVMRAYDPGYLALDAQSFGERSLPENEEGVFMGVTFQPKKRWEINARMDIYRFPWLTFSASAPSTGYEYLLKNTLRIKPGIQLAADMRIESKSDNLSDSDPIRRVSARSTVQGGFYLSLETERKLTCRIRARWKKSVLEKFVSRGYAACLELGWSVRRLKLNYRYTLFNTEGFESRIYIYEQDLWGSFSLPSFQGTGFSQYLLMRYRATRIIDVWTKISTMKRSNSGQLIMDEENFLVSFQLRIKI